MLKVFTVGRVASASQLVTNPDIEKMSMHLEVVPIGWHKGREGNDHRAIVPVQLDDYQTRRYLRMGFVGCKIAIDGEMEQTSAYPGGFVVKARQVDYLSYRKSQTPSNDVDEAPAMEEASDHPASDPI